MAIKDEFLDLLRVPAGDETRRASILQLRLVGIGLGEYCGRCGGSGSYSFNSMDGSRCYGCGGSGYRARRLSADLLEQAREAVVAGKLDAYLEQARAKAAAKSAAKGAEKAVMDAWKATGIANMYRWQDAANKIEPHLTISKFNHRMSTAYAHVSKLADEYLSAGFRVRRAKNGAERAAAEAALQAAAETLAEARDLALEVIKQAANEANAFVAAQQTAQ